MTDFNELEAIWKQQSTAAKTDATVLVNKAIQQQQQLQFRQRSTVVILLVTALVLVWYFLFYLPINHTTIQLSATLMIGSLVLRMLAEMLSHWQLRQIDLLQSLKQYVQTFTRFYIWRQWIHFALTPLVMIGYSLGFILMLPLFKTNMSHGWYQYILFSGSIFLIAFSIFLYWNTRREMKILKSMKEVRGVLS